MDETMRIRAHVVQRMNQAKAHGWRLVERALYGLLEDIDRGWTIKEKEHAQFEPAGPAKFVIGQQAEYTIEHMPVTVVGAELVQCHNIHTNQPVDAWMWVYEVDSEEGLIPVWECFLKEA